MKTSKKIIACALAGLLGNATFALDAVNVAGVAVTPYARIVAGIDYTTNLLDKGIQGDRSRLASNQWGTSFWGFRADAPLEAGWTALARVESGFGTDTGKTNTSDTLFDRYAYVGVSHARFGQLTAGNHLWISNDLEDLDPMGNQSFGYNSLVGNRNGLAGAKTVLYRSPEWHGLQAAYMHMFGGVVGSAGRSSGDGVSVSFRQGGLQLRAIYDKVADKYGHFSGGELYGLGSQGEWTYSKNLGFGASYLVGPAKLFVGYNRVTAPDASYLWDSTFDDKAQQFWLGANYQLTPKATLLGAVYHMKESYSDKKSNLFVVGTNYDWSQYLTLYATVGHIGNNAISSAIVSKTGANDHALTYSDTACENAADCNGASSLGGYAGFALKF